MDIVLSLKEALKNALSHLNIETDLALIVIETTKDHNHGDYATNVALKFAKASGSNPRDFASDLIKKLDVPFVDKIEIADPGFINFFLKNNSMTSILSRINQEKDNYGRGENKKKKVNVEFVSANPTGPLHVGHARGAAIGDSICRILDFAGYDVTREYYINDAGNQIDNLAKSLEARYREALGLDFSIPEDGYHGEDIVEIAQTLVKEIGDKALSFPDSLSFFKEKGMELELNRIKNDLRNFRVTFDVFSSEKAIRSNSAVEKELQFLNKYIYKENDACLLRTTEFLDDKDRVIVKSNGDYTYFLPDIVYHVNKMSRGFDELIDVLGADHHGYINRMKSALMMHGYSKDILDIELIQMVRIMKEGNEIVASKRTGNAYTLRELCEDAGVDAARYFFAMRAATSHLDFDLDLAKEQSSNNPVYYAQYAHARLNSILDSAKDIKIDFSGKELNKISETAILKHLSSFPEVVESAAKEKAPYKITNYIHDLAEKIHAFYSECRVIDLENLSITQSRLALCSACKQVLKNALVLIGVNAPEHM